MNGRSPASLFLFCAASLLSNCGNPTDVVVACQQPSELQADSGLTLSGNVSIKDASGAISAELGKKVASKFSQADPNSWNIIVQTYQYQTCQLVNKLPCDGLESGACLKAKTDIINVGFDKIVGMKNEEERRRQEQAEAKKATMIDACVADKVAMYEQPVPKSAEDSVTAEAPGASGTGRTEQKLMCYSVGARQEVIGASISAKSCKGDRCSASAPEYSEQSRKVCSTIRAWNDGRRFGGGGGANYTLSVLIKNIPNDETKQQFRAQCEAASP